MNSNGNNRYNRNSSGGRRPAGDRTGADRSGARQNTTRRLPPTGQGSARGGASKPGTGIVRNYTSDGKRIERFNVHISEEDYENEITFDSKRGQRDKRLAEQRRNSKKFDETAIARRDVPISRTRVITSRSGERYEIPEESSLPPKLLRKIKKNQKSRGCLVSVVYAAIICAISALLAFYAIVGINDMFGLVKDDVEIIVNVSDSDRNLDAITRLLDENNVVDYPFFFKLYASFTNKNADFKRGTFTLNRKSDYDMIIRKLTRPAAADKSTIKVTIPEGLNLMQIAELLDYNEVCGKDAFFYTLETHEWKHAFFKEIPKRGSLGVAPTALDHDVLPAKNKVRRYADAVHPELKEVGVDDILRQNKISDEELIQQNELKDLSITKEELRDIRYNYTFATYTYRLEGYLFPDTYDFYLSEGSQKAINRLLNAFDSKVYSSTDVALKNHLNDLNSRFGQRIKKTIDMDFVITMASIIEREAQKPEDMRNVASVFYNRMKNNDGEGIGGRLQSDATLWYPFSTKKAMLESDLLTDEEKANYSSKYSTLSNPGLPAGPICCPGLNAIKAALDPSDTNYLYFFSDKEGNFHFTSNYADFQSQWAQYGG